MATYTYKCNACGHQFDRILSMKDMDTPTQEPCPNCSETAVKQIIVSPTPLGDPHRMGLIKPDDSWREFLRGIKKKNPGCTDFNTF